MKQSELDRHAVSRGVARYNKTLLNSMKSEDTADTGAGRAIIGHFMKALSKEINEWKKHVKKYSAGSLALYFPLVDSLPTETCSFISLMYLLGNLHKGLSRNAICAGIGTRINEEFKYREFRKQRRDEYNSIERLADRRIGFTYRRSVFNHYIKENNILNELTWTTKEQSNVGLLMLEFIQQSTDLITTRQIAKKVGKGIRQTTYVDPSTSLTNWLQRYNKKHEALCPYFEPRVEPAPNWSEIFVSFKGTELPSIPFIKENRSVKLNQSQNSELTDIYNSVNSLQLTQWSINKDVYKVARNVFDSNWIVSNIYGSKLMDMPTKPLDIDTNELARIEWRRSAARTHANNVPLKSKIIQASETLAIANKFQNEDNIYFQYQLDFRGRVYALNPFLNPQSTDLAKSLLTFSKGESIDNQEQLNWLKMHGANNFGVDKVSFQDRFDWVDANTDLITAVANDPMSNREWVDADSPFGFLAFCFEYRNFINTGFGYKSRLPIGIDGSNNGLQILSLLSRDEATGASTNCVPSEKPRDVYQDVADKLIDILGKEDTEESRFWISFGVNRKTCKKSVMTIPYGLTLYSCKDYIMMWFVEELNKKGIELLPKEIMNLSQYLGVRLWSAIDSCIGKAKQTMSWLQSVSYMLAKEDKPITWRTPMGLLVSQHYNKEILNQSLIRVYGKSLQTCYVTEGKQISKQKQKTGISPNFVHSLDASCLQKAVLFASKFGINNFQVVHDSFATTASRTTELGACVREAYKQIFQQDQLKAFRDGIGRDDLPSLPEYGTLDVELLQDCEYLFA